MKKIVSWTLVLLLIAAVFSSCQKEEEETQLYYPVTQDFDTIDPQIVSADSSKLIAYNCYEGLVRLDENGKIVAAGADSWTVSDDSLVYTFSLRKDARWYLTNTSKEELSDADASKSALPAGFDDRVTAKDYVFGLRRAVDPATASADGKYLSAIRNASDILGGKKQTSELGVVALDEYTVQITLDYADPDFLYYLTRLAAMPCNETFFNACRGRYGLAMEYMLCNGVYMVYRWTQGSVVRLEKNPLYTGDSKAKNDRVWVYYVEDASTVASKIKGGTYDAGYVSAGEAEAFQGKKGYTLTPRNDVLWGYWFNSRSDKFALTELREAFAASTDKSVLTPPSYIAQSTDRIVTDALSPYYDYTPSPIAYDEKSAGEKYKEAMAKNENVTASMTVTVLTSDDFAESVTKQIQIWQRVFGVDVKIRTESREEAQKLFASGDFEIAFLPVSVEATNTAEFFRTFTTDSTYNVTGYANPNYDALLSSLSDTMTDEEQTEVYKSCEQSLISHGVVIPAFTEASYFILGENVTGIYSFSKNEVYFRNGYFV